MNYDIIIAGCGMAGAVAGLTALKKNQATLIIEEVERESIGKKICGELVAQKALNLLKNEFHLSVTGYPLKGLEIRTSSGYKAHVKEPLCTVDRWQMQQILVEELLDRGAELTHETVKSSAGKTSVKGVKTKDSTYSGTVTLDCSGITSVLRKLLIPEPQLLGLAYKENLILKEPITTEYALLLFNKQVLPAGYMWCFPKNEYEVNVGAGGLVRKAHLKEKLEVVIRTLKIGVKKREFPGFGVVPLGRPLPSAVYPGLLVCGDAACHVNPLTGEGIAPAVTAGYLAGNVAAEAAKSNDSSLERLWKYNCDFAREYGIIHAPLIVMRDFLVSLSDAELDNFIKYMSDDDLTQLIKGKIHYSWARITKIFLENWRKPHFLYRSFAALNRVKKVITLYEKYPGEPKNFFLWKQVLDVLLE